MLQMKGITKSFSGNMVLRDVQFDLAPGEIHALMGENGAGKSTMMKVLTGIHPKDGGTIHWKGKEVTFKTPQEAEEAGIAVIHQELNILPYLSIAENLFLGKEETLGKTGILKTKKMETEAKERLAALGLHVDPAAEAATLSVGQQQIVEIARALSSNAEVIIMDEPTAALTDREIEQLFKTVRALKEQGVAFIYISHRMEEIFAICDRITVLRDGEWVGVKRIADTNFDEIVQMMVGRALGDRFPIRTCEVGETVLEVTGLAREPYFRDISFDVKQGEIVALAGLMGAGRTEIVQSLFGYRKASAGEVKINGKVVKIRTPYDAIQEGLAYVTEDRKSEGLILDFSVEENISLTNFKDLSANGLMSAKKERALFDRMKERLGIRTSSPELPVKSLSGGNQQKVVLSKWLGTNPSILILDEPTRGVDVGAKKEIYSIMNELAEKGVAIVMISSELPEVLGMADRVLVMHEGKLTANLDNQDLTQEQIMHYATGGGARV